MAKGKVARGTIYLMAAQGVFLVSGYAIHLGLARFLGPAIYGMYGVVISLLAWIEMAVINGIPTAVEKYVAEKRSSVSSVKKRAVRIQVVYSASIFILVLALSPVIAGILGDKRLSIYLQIAAIDIPIYALFYVYLGVLNGVRDFGKQAIGMMIYSLSKMTVVLILVASGLSLTGAFVGNIIASLFGLVALIYFSKAYYFNESNGESNEINKTALVKFAVPIILLIFSKQFTSHLDLFCVKALIRDDVVTGFYTAAVTIAKAPASIFVGLVYTLFPSLVKSIADRNEKLVQSYIRQSLRFLLVMGTPLIFLVGPTSTNFVTLMFSSVYVAAAPMLTVLIVGWIFATFLMVLSSIMVADNKPYKMILITFVLIIIDFVLILKLIPLYGAIGAAWATTISYFVGMVIVAAYVFHRFKVLVAPLTVLRVGAGCMIVYAIVSLYQAPHILLLLEYVVLYCIYIGVLYVTGEIKSEDFTTLTSGLLGK